MFGYMAASDHLQPQQFDAKAYDDNAAYNAQWTKDNMKPKQHNDSPLEHLIKHVLQTNSRKE